jgi:hypothetical protein
MTAYDNNKDKGIAFIYRFDIVSWDYTIASYVLYFILWQKLDIYILFFLLFLLISVKKL